MWDVVTHPCPNINGGLTKLLLNSGYGWVITYPCLKSMLVYLNSVGKRPLTPKYIWSVDLKHFHYAKHKIYLYSILQTWDIIILHSSFLFSQNLGWKMCHCLTILNWFWVFCFKWQNYEKLIAPKWSMKFKRLCQKNNPIKCLNFIFWLLNYVSGIWHFLIGPTLHYAIDLHTVSVAGKLQETKRKANPNLHVCSF